MEEDVGVKVTVTRLRRRLSVEQSEDGSSPAPSTPTKKRGGRLAAKPQLELIDENTPVSSPRKTRRKSLATEAEEKPITPSRRSARIKSNSSIVSETQSVQATDSPRAKRAARRNSQAGSDNEGPATPARQTRRTRKDSASSVENQETSTLSKPLPVVEMVIEEEPENEVQKAANKSKSSPTAASEELSPNSARKSKRLLEKRNRRSGSHNTDQDCSTNTVQNKSLNDTTTNDKASSESESISRSPLNKSVKSKELTDELSESNMSLLKKLDTETKTNKSSHNKSASALNIEPNDKGKRNRTESWPTITASGDTERINFSDNELSKKRKDESNKFSANNDSPKINKTDTSINKKNTSQSFLDTSNRKKRQSETSFTKDMTSKDGGLETNEALSTKENNISRNEILTVKSDNTNNVTNDVMEVLFGDAPDNVQVTVYFEDSDSNNAGAEATDKIRHLDSEDQCVPVVKHDKESLSPKEPTIVSNAGDVFSNQLINDNSSHFDVNMSKGITNDVDNSCEPMDIDETIHDEILQKSEETLNRSKTERKSLPSSQHTTTLEEADKSKRKSSISNSASGTLDRSKDDNKSTLILSQIKDVSSTSENVNSPKKREINEVLSKSDVSNINKKISKGNHSLNDIKVTPKQKTIQKLSMQTSTPLTTQQLDMKTKVDGENESTKKNKAIFSKSIHNSDSSEDDSDEDEPSVGKNKLLDDEAEEANNDYESGDSQDEEERRYEAENEIVERGETLTSDDDISNDTDYEKDSFVVSSDVEDSELLSGSGDDLAMSDNELTMSKKSKKKFNERKLKEQKNASREMFESRHKLNTSDQKSPNPKTKKNKMRIDSSLLTSDEEVVTKPKKNNRMRLDSTNETCAKQEDNNVSLNKSKKKDTSLQDTTLNTIDKQEDTNVSLKKIKNYNKSMQDSICSKSVVDEKEITICNESTIDNIDPLQVHLKREPKTPQKGLNISVVQFTDRQEIENVQVTESNSILNQTGTDPLQATMACDETSDSSENEEIMQNYDSVLNELNKDKKTKFNNNNVSLNMDNKSKKNRVEPIIDQLNLTQTKKPKKNKNLSDVLDSKPVQSSDKKPDSDNEDSSNSIDLQLLFSEDNCSNEDESQNKADNDSLFIPLKKSTGKTDIRESIGMNTSQKDSTLNESTKKKKRKSSIAPSKEEQDSSQADNETSLNKSTSKKNKERSALALELAEDPEESIHAEDNNEFNKSNSKKKKQRTFSAAETAAESLDVRNGSLNESCMKKKKKRSFSEPTVEESQDVCNKSKDNNVSLNEKKKKKHSISEPAVEEPQDILNKSKDVDASLNQSGLKKKMKHSISEPVIEETQDILNKSKNTNASLNESGIKKKKKHSISEPAAEESQDILNKSKDVDASLNQSGLKKKMKHSISEPVIEETQDILNKSKNTNVSLNESGIKKKKKHSISEPAAEESQDSWNKSKDVNVSLYESGLKKKKKNYISEPTEESQEINNSVEPVLNESIKKKKKRKSSLNVQDTEQREDGLFFIDTKGTLDDTKETTKESNAIITPRSEKKKEKKISQKVESLVCDEDSDGAPDEAPYLSVKATEADLQITETVSEPAETGSGKKKKKKNKKSPAAANQSGQNLDTENSIASNSKKRKRKPSNSENSQNLGDVQESVETVMLNVLTGSHKKKRKISHNEDNNTSGTSESKQPKKKNKKNRDIDFQETAFELETVETQIKKNKKRKNRDEDGDNKQTKVSKDSSFQEVHVPRLPDSILTQLDDKPRKLDTPKVIATSNFIVENARQKRAKPSNYLEESIYLDADTPIAKKEKPRIKKPKVLPFIPTASISDSGFTTNFKINKLSQTTKFEAEPFGFSKESYLQKKNIKKLGTYDRYKKQIHHKMSKF